AIGRQGRSERATDGRVDRIRSLPGAGRDRDCPVGRMGWAVVAWTRKGDRAAKRRKVIAHETEQKEIVRERDDYRCRVPGCMNPFRGVEVAHLEDKGMG